MAIVSDDTDVVVSLIESIKQVISYLANCDLLETPVLLIEVLLCCSMMQNFRWVTKII